MGEAPLANLWAFWWSLCSACSASASPTKAAAASTPAWCIPLPRAFRRCQASSMKCLGPPIRVSAGAPRPLEKQRHRVAVLHEAGRGHVQSHRGAQQPGSVQVDADPTALGQEVHLGRSADSGRRGQARSRGRGWFCPRPPARLLDEPQGAAVRRAGW